MIRKTVLAAGVLLVAVSVSAQSPFEKIHGDILRKMEISRAQAAFGRTPFLAPQPTPNQLLFDVQHYALEIAINPTTQEVDGKVQATIKSLTSALDSVQLDANDVLTISSVGVVGGDPLGWHRAGGILTILLSAPLPYGGIITLEIRYGGFPAPVANPGLFFRSVSGTPLIFSLSEPWSARTWWPCKDYPDDKATFDIDFSVPEGLTAASNGTFLGSHAETRWSAPYRSYHWQESYEMATYLASIAATNYVRLDDHFVYAPGDTMPVTHYVYPGFVANAQIDFSITVPALTYFSQAFGLYPFIQEKYGVALCTLGGGMEHQTLTSYGASLVTGTHYYDWVFVHEMSHMWFGDMITCKNWVHVWLNEGFASYAEALWFEHLQGPEKLKTYMEGKDHPSRWTGPILRDPGNTNPWYYFDNVVYDKAAWVLHMLRHVVGDSTFFDILQDYCADPRYRFGAAETNDFRAICEAHTGLSLGWFFNEWLTRTDRLTYEWSYKAYPLNGDLNLTIWVDQVQDSLYVMPLDFKILTNTGVLDTALCVDERHDEFHLTFDGSTSIADVLLDPGHWVLCTQTEVVTEEPVAPSAVFLEQNVPNPFNPRTVIRFGLEKPSAVRIEVFDLRGAFVKTLVDRPLNAGIHEAEWNGTNEHGDPLASGVYFYRLRTGAGEITRKMILLR